MAGLPAWQDFTNKTPGWESVGAEPPQERKTAGYQAGYKPPADWFNWFWTRVSKCITEIQGKTKTLWQDAQLKSPVGSVTMFGGAAAPQGWLLCEGQAVSRTEYADLFAVLGVVYGGEGTTTFNLPDMRDRVAVGSGGAYALAAKIGEKTHAHTVTVNNTTLTTAQVPAHEHETIATREIEMMPSGKHNHFSGAAKTLWTRPASGGGQPDMGGSTSSYRFSVSGESPGEGLHTHSYSIPALKMNKVGGGGGHNHIVGTGDKSATESSLQPSLGLSFIIKY